ncbi:MAG: hypothetical protein HC802_17580, partial [Caldilineaceae bacterium]|nr:hypothetical protein [Caldilineaceae bacterium]
GFSLEGGFASNGYAEHSPDGYSMVAGLVAEVVLTFMFLTIILGATDERAPAGFAPIAIGLGLTLIHAALAPSGQPIWLEMARRSAQALANLESAGRTMPDILTKDALHNAMVTHAAFGGSTNLLLHIPAIAHAAGLRRPEVADWARINRATPRLVDVLPNGPVGHPTVRVFMAGGVPEVMLHLRNLDLLRLDALTVHGRPLGEMLEIWEKSERRKRLRERLFQEDGIDPDDVIMAPAVAARAA